MNQVEGDPHVFNGDDDDDDDDEDDPDDPEGRPANPGGGDHPEGGPANTGSSPANGHVKKEQVKEEQLGSVKKEMKVEPGVKEEPKVKSEMDKPVKMDLASMRANGAVGLGAVKTEFAMAFGGGNSINQAQRPKVDPFQSSHAAQAGAEGDESDSDIEFVGDDFVAH